MDIKYQTTYNTDLLGDFKKKVLEDYLDYLLSRGICVIVWLETKSVVEGYLFEAYNSRCIWSIDGPAVRKNTLDQNLKPS